MKTAVIRKYFAASSVIILVLAASIAFLNLQGSYAGPPPILDPEFKLWATGPAGRDLMVWGFQSVKGSSDRVVMNETFKQGNHAVGLGIFQSGLGSGWVYESITQTLDGGRLFALFNATLDISLLKEPCICDSDPFNKTAVRLSVDASDGIHTLSFVFSDQRQGTLTLPNYRIVLLPTPSGQWSSQNLNFEKQYELAHWPVPDRLTLSVTFGVAPDALGWHYAYLNQITKSDRQNSSLTLIANWILLAQRLATRHPG